MNIRSKLRQIRFQMLAVWGVFAGAAGMAGVKSSGHVIPGWLIWLTVILGVIVLFVWIVSVNPDKRVETTESKGDRSASNRHSEIETIEKAVDEPIELEFWGKRNGVNHFSVKNICGEDIPNDHVLLISFDGAPARDVALDASVTGKEHSDYFGKIEMLYCKKEKGISKAEKLITEKFDKRIFSREQWEKGTGKISILEVIKK